MGLFHFSTMTKIQISTAEYVEITQDPDPVSPAEWGSVGTIAYARDSHYVFGTKAVTHDEMRDIERQITIGTLIGMPVYAYIHGGTRIKAADENPFSCPWDSGQSGFVYATREAVFREYGGKRMTKRIREAARNLLRAEVETFSQYLDGDVWLVTHVKDGEIVECFGGYYGWDYAMQEAKEWAAAARADACNEIQMELV